MSNENVFSYTYSATANQEVLNIRKKYLPREENKLEELKALDARVKKPADVLALSWGSLSALIMGAGMSLVMTDIGAVVGIGDGMASGIILGIIGLGLSLVTYPMWKHIVATRKKKFAPRILELSEALLRQ